MEFVQTSYTVQEILDPAVNICVVLNGETERNVFVTLITANGSAQGI